MRNSTEKGDGIGVFSTVVNMLHLYVS